MAQLLAFLDKVIGFFRQPLAKLAILALMGVGYFLLKGGSQAKAEAKDKIIYIIMGILLILLAGPIVQDLIG